MNIIRKSLFSRGIFVMAAVGMVLPFILSCNSKTSVGSIQAERKLSGGRKVRNPRYIDIMEKVLSAYTIEHIDRYYNDVKKDSLKEQGFPRLTANIGILIAHGRRTDLKSRFEKMMDLCGEEIPKRKFASNEFSIKEIIFCILELEKTDVFPKEKIEQWKNALKNVTVENCYKVYATAPDSKVHNWAAFTMVSEWMRYLIGAAPEDRTFIDNQAASQLQWVEENGMYRDPDEPMVYDLVTRGLFSVLFHFGYRGKYFESWDNALKRAGLLMPKMISVTGELPYGGRSNQFIHNESHCLIITEYEAARYAKEGDSKTASKFKAIADRSLECIEKCLMQTPISHVKNAFPISSKYGCESYAYFDKYMITAASFLYVAYLFSDESIPVGKIDDLTGETWQSSEHFHKLFMRAGEYFAEYDYRADYHYDASGLGRMHRKNAPGALCISTPGCSHPKYVIDVENAEDFAIVPEVMSNGKWLSGASPEAVHQVLEHSAVGETASAKIRCVWQDGICADSSYSLDKNGMQISVEGKGNVGLLLPAFEFDGKEKTEITNSGKTLTIKYKNWNCRYQIEKGNITDTGKTGCNRNGHYKLFRADGEGSLKVKISIQPEA